TRKDVRSRSSYSTGRPVVEKPIASFSRRSVRTTRIASAASRSSTIRVPLEERTTRRNSEPSAEVRENVVYRVLNGRPVDSRSRKPQPPAAAAATSSRPSAWRRSMAGSDDEVDEPAGHDDELAQGLAAAVARIGLRGERRGLDGLPVGVGRDADRPTDLAVDLQHELDLVEGERIGVDLGPGRVEQ